jgi:hypothetical protein
VERHQARRRFEERCRVYRDDRRDDHDDIAIGEPGNLRFSAKILIVSAKQQFFVTETSAATTSDAR